MAFGVVNSKILIRDGPRFQPLSDTNGKFSLRRKPGRWRWWKRGANYRQETETERDSGDLTGSEPGLWFWTRGDRLCRWWRRRRRRRLLMEDNGFYVHWTRLVALSVMVEFFFFINTSELTRRNKLVKRKKKKAQAHGVEAKWPLPFSIFLLTFLAPFSSHALSLTLLIYFCCVLQNKLIIYCLLIHCTNADWWIFLSSISSFFYLDLESRSFMRSSWPQRHHLIGKVVLPHPLTLSAAKHPTYRQPWSTHPGCFNDEPFAPVRKKKSQQRRSESFSRAGKVNRGRKKQQATTNNQPWIIFFFRSRLRSRLPPSLNLLVMFPNKAQ